MPATGAKLGTKTRFLREDPVGELRDGRWREVLHLYPRALALIDQWPELPEG